MDLILIRLPIHSTVNNFTMTELNIRDKTVKGT